MSNDDGDNDRLTIHVPPGDKGDEVLMDLIPSLWRLAKSRQQANRAQNNTDHETDHDTDTDHDDQPSGPD